MKRREQPPSWVRGSEIESWQYAYEGTMREGSSHSEARRAADEHIKHGRRQRRGGEGYDNSEYAENPISGVGIALGIAAVVGLGWLLLRKKEPAKNTPTIEPPVVTVTPNATTPVVNFIPITIVGCTLNQANWESWLAQAVRYGPWLTQTGTPPDWSVIQAQYPNLANVDSVRGAAATGNGSEIWLYGAFGIPFKRDDARQNICDWVADPTTPILAT